MMTRFSSRLYYPFGKSSGQHIIRCLKNTKCENERRGPVKPGAAVMELLAVWRHNKPKTKKRVHPLQPVPWKMRLEMLD